MTESFPRPTGVATYTMTRGNDLKVGDTIKRYAIGALDFWKVVKVEDFELDLVVEGDPTGRIRLEHRPMPGEQTKAPLDLSVPFGDREWSVVKYIPFPEPQANVDAEDMLTYRALVEGDQPLRVIVNGKPQMIPSRIAPAPEPMVGPGPSGASDVTPLRSSSDPFATFESVSRLEGATVAPPLMAYPRTAGEFAARWNSWSQDYRNTWMDRYNERADEQIRQQEGSALEAPGGFQIDDTGLGKVIWDASRTDEGSISATGASVIARAILSEFEVYPKGRKLFPASLESGDTIIKISDSGYHRKGDRYIVTRFSKDRTTFWADRLEPDGNRAKGGNGYMFELPLKPEDWDVDMTASPTQNGE